MKRRDFLRKVGGAVTVSASDGIFQRLALADPKSLVPSEMPQGALESAAMESLPGKKPLIKRTLRPPNIETPLSYFNELFTPNEAFFVRYHLSNIPKVDTQEWKLKIGGEAIERPIEFSLKELRRNFESVEIAAVNQCAGNRRGLVQPHVSGIQWGYGAMGNALWRGIRLRDVLNRAGIKKNALEVVADGSDSGHIPRLPDFVKSLPLEKALDENTLIAFEMNGEPLPHWHGYPARLVVPGWTATYWMKHLQSINVASKPFDGFWMKTAYRVPTQAFPMLDKFASQASDVNTPVTEIPVNSLITNIEDSQTFNSGQLLNMNGIAWDGGHGIERIEISIDDGKSWHQAELREDHGRFSWRQWRFQFTPQEPGALTIITRATNRKGSTQPDQLVQNPAGYHHNRVQKLKIIIA